MTKMRFSPSRTSLLSVLITVTLLLYATPRAGADFIVASDFGDTTVWTPVKDGPEAITLQAGQDQFTVSVPGVYTTLWTVGYKTAFALQGDFTFDANFCLGTWPQVNHVRIGISLFHPPQGSAIERTSEGWGVDECYIFDGVGQGIVVTDANETAGTLRLTRTGSILSGYYLKNNNWTYVGSGPVSTDDFQAGLMVWSDYGGGGGVGVTFSHPVISTDGYGPIPTPVPEPSTWLGGALLALPFGVQAIRRLRNH